MRILLISASDGGGGGNLVPFNLLQQYIQKGHDAWMAVGSKVSNHSKVFTIPAWRNQCSGLFVLDCAERWALKQQAKGARGMWRLVDLAKRIKSIGSGMKRRWGRENFSFPGTWRLMDDLTDGIDIIHCHILHGDYFDLRVLKPLSKRKPVVVTLHDEWLYTGHCAYSMVCERWINGCGKCPDLKRYPALLRDGTRFNWEAKQKIYANANLFLLAPSQWILERSEKSILRAKSRALILNGVDHKIFRFREKLEARSKLSWPLDSKIVLTVANRVRTNVYKDWPTLQAAFDLLGRNFGAPVLCVCLGEEGQEYTTGQVRVIFEPFNDDAYTVAAHYQAADIFVHSANADTFPTTVLEAMACGVPVVATSAGGVPEQVIQGVTGLLVPLSSPMEMANAIISLLNDPSRCEAMSKASVAKSIKLHDVRQSASRQLEYYAKAIAMHAQMSDVKKK